MKKIFRTLIAAGCIILIITGCSTESKIVELPEIREIQTVQYNSIKMPAGRLETETLTALVQDLESLRPVKDDHIEMNGTYDTISLIYENGNKDVFLFWKENDSWYAETLDGDIYENADFVQNYIDHTEMDFKPGVSVPDLFWIKFLNTYDYVDDYDILSELANCLTQGYSLEQAAEITEAKVKRDEILYQYAVSQNFKPTDEKLQNYMFEIIGQLKTMSNYTDLETFFTESGTTIEKEIDKRDQNIRKELSIQMLYNDRYDAFRCGEDMIGETVYWDFETYWNAFLEKIILTQQLPDETDIESQMTKALEYVISNKLENALMLMK